MTKGRNFILGLATLFAGLFALSGSQAAGVAADEFKMVIESDIKYLQTKLADPAGAGKAKASLKSTSILIAYMAQSQMEGGKGDKKQLATLRDDALKVAEAVAKKDYAAAKKLADALKVDVPANAAAKTEPVKLTDAHGFDLSELMAPFRLERANGRGYEKGIRDNAKKLAAKEDALILAIRTIALAELTEQYAPKTPEGKKTPAAWTKYSKEMADAAKEAADSLRGDGKKAPAAFKKVDASCTNCHNIFRDE